MSLGISGVVLDLCITGNASESSLSVAQAVKERLWRNLFVRLVSVLLQARFSVCPHPYQKTMHDLIRSARRWLGSDNAYDDLPDNIRKSITQQQDTSERLIGWIQIVILLVFTILYTASPNTYPENAVIRPVPVFLVAYFVFTCFRLYLAYKSSLSVGVLVLSIVVDMGLLLGLIFSFHIQYMQPPSFYLKAPTLLYVFIFIALRALRFEPGYVLLSGIVGSLGWMVLVVYAISADYSADHASSMLTRDYVYYLTSNTILLGAELDKVISILLVSVILTIAIARARRLLVRSIIDGSTAKNLSHFVPESVAAQIVQAQGRLIDAQTEMREASILFVDLVSFTSLAERLSPEELIVILNEYFSLISVPIERNNGVINQFQGDAILASFNLPTRDSDHACSAVSAALEIEKLVSKHEFHKGIKLRTRAGVNTGSVVGGFIGTPNRLSYTVYGDDVNIAARLQELSKHHNSKNLISLRTRKLCRNDKFVFKLKGNEILRGRQTASQVFEATFRQV